MENSPPPHNSAWWMTDTWIATGGAGRRTPC